MNSTEFTCWCGRYKGWITEGKTTKPCPNCGNRYLGAYNKKKLTIEAIRIKGNFEYEIKKT